MVKILFENEMISKINFHQVWERNRFFITEKQNLDEKGISYQNEWVFSGRHEGAEKKHSYSFL